MIGSQWMRTGSRCTGSPASVESSTPCAVTTAPSSSSRITTSRVCERMAGMSEAMNISPRPRPTTTLPAPCFAATSRSAAAVETTPIAEEPGTSAPAAFPAPAGGRAHLEDAVVEDGDARGIVAAVLEALEPFHDDPDRALVPHVADDAA